MRGGPRPPRPAASALTSPPVGAPSVAVLAESPGGRRPERDRGGPPAGAGGRGFTDNRGQAPGPGPRRDTEEDLRATASRVRAPVPVRRDEAARAARIPDRARRRSGPLVKTADLAHVPQVAHLGHLPRLLHYPKMPSPAMSRCGHSVSSSSFGKRRSNRKPRIAPGSGGERRESSRQADHRRGRRLPNRRRHGIRSQRTPASAAAAETDPQGTVRIRLDAISGRSRPMPESIDWL